MGLLSLLAAAVIIILLLVFSNFSFSSLNFSPANSKDIQNEAQDVVDSAIEKTKFEQKQIKDLDLP